MALSLPGLKAEVGSKSKSMNGTTNQAAKEAHDEELAKMEAEIAAQASAPATPEATPAAPSASPEATTPDHSADGATTTPPAETPAPAPKATEEEDESLSEEEVQKLSGKAQKRFKSLADENMRIKRENEFLRTHMKKPAEDPEPQPEPASFRLPWETEEEDDGGEDPAVIARREALAVVAEERRQEKILGNLENDSSYLEEKFPELNPQNEKYDPTLVTQISVWYKGLFKDNNDLRLKDFVTELMTLRASGIDRGRSEVTDKIVKQAAQQAVIPNAPTTPAASSVEQKIQGAKTMAELEALEAQL